ncbi:MAG: sporulation protein YunB [Thermacetogeniaceae bacterium]
MAALYRRAPDIRWIPLAVFAALVILVGGFILFESDLRPTIKTIAEAEARWVATDAVNRAIRDKIANVDYNQLIMVQKDNQGQIVLMQPNIVRINQLASDITLSIQSALQGLVNEQFSIPVGQVLGSQLLANYGPRVKVSIYPIGTVRTSVFDKFEAAGINQTRHRIYLDIETQVQVVVPLVSSDVTVSTQVPITDTVIVGPVPTFYANFFTGGSP